MNTKKKLLITGASGFLGNALIRTAKTDWHIIGCYHRQPLLGECPVKIQIDLSDKKQFALLFDQIKPDAVIHAAAISRIDQCETYPSESKKINVDISKCIARICSDRATPMAFTSTDLVFDGKYPPYKEDSSKTPMSVYGKQKAMAEDGILKLYPKAAVCRIPLLVGYNDRYDNFTKTMMKAIGERKMLSLFYNEVRTPVDYDSAALGLLLALEKMNGIVHLGGRKSMSRYEIGLHFAQYLNVSEPAIHCISLEDAGLDKIRPQDVSLDSSKAYERGYAPADIDEAIRIMAINFYEENGK